MPIMPQSTANVDTFDKEFEEKEKAKEVKNIAKTFISTIIAAGAILGGLVVAKRTGVVKNVQNPTKAWDKVQSKLAKAGGNIETQTINWYNRIKNTVTKTQKNEKTYETLSKLDSITS